MNCLLVNLAVADLMVAVFFSPLYIFIHMFTHPDGVSGDVLCMLLTGGSFGWVGASSSAFTLVAIATERYYTVKYPHGNKGKLTSRKLKVGLHSSHRKLRGVFISLKKLIVKFSTISNISLDIL